MTRRGELLATLARLLAEAVPVVAELAALEGAAPKPLPSRPRRRAPRPLVPSSAPVDPEVRDAARRILARRGLHLVAVPRPKE